jgi:isopropylmalate/homocitrate/citramalate synthase
VTGFLIFPSCDGSAIEGCIEDLCIKNITGNSKILEITNEAVNNSDNVEKLKTKSKNILHTYLSLTNNFVSYKLGEATRANAFNLESEDIENLTKFFIDMFKKSEK